MRGAGGGKKKAGASPTIRISAGKWKGRRIEAPPGARPTSSRAREALFDLLGPRLSGARVLDLFAGSGAVGFEALSRGASSAVFVETDAGALGRTLDRLHAADEGARILACDADSAVARLISRGESFDLIFCDPPYGAPRLPGGLASVLAPGGELVIQRDAGSSCPPVSGLSAVRTRAYGRNVFHFLAATPAASLTDRHGKC
jgi:16S rRNA (guanine966-N2)-methyltransferase